MSREEKRAAAASLYERWIRHGDEPNMRLEEMYAAIAEEEEYGIKVEGRRL